MEETKIIIKAVPLQHLRPGQSGMVRLKLNAYNAVVDLANESGLTISGIVSSIIEQAIEKELIQFDRVKEENI